METIKETIKKTIKKTINEISHSDAIEAMKRADDYLIEYLPSQYEHIFVSSTGIHIDKMSIDKRAFGLMGRSGSGVEKATGIDAVLFEKGKNHSKYILVKIYLPKISNGIYHINYNYPTDIRDKKQCWNYLNGINMHFMVVRKKYDSIMICLERFDKFPVEDYQANHKYGNDKRENRMTLRRGVHEKLFVLPSQFAELLKQKFDENK